jgi:microtubule-associated protein, RP/EB family
MARVKMNAKHEYEFIANFKVMQNVFKSKRIEKARLVPLPVNSIYPLPVALTAHPRREVSQM